MKKLLIVLALISAISSVFIVPVSAAPVSTQNHNLVALAEGSTIWDQVEQYTDNQQAQKEAVQTLSPFLTFLFFIIAVASVIVVVITIISIVFRAGSVKAGKSSFHKKWVIETAVILALCIVFGGSSGLKVLKALQTVTVDPTVKIITKPIDQNPGSQNQGTNSQTQTQPNSTHK